MKGDIRLSEKHGVNPSLGVCFWCGEEDGTVVLLGKLPGDAEAPRYVCTSYEPCKACVERRKAGIFMAEFDRPPSQGGTPTGRWFIMSDEDARRCLAPSIVESIIARRECHVEREAFDALTQGMPTVTPKQLEAQAN